MVIVAALSAELQRILKVLAPCADEFCCLKAIYVFGSVARGDAHAGSDLDLAFDYIEGLEKDNGAMESFTRFQRHIEGRKKLLGKMVGRPVSVHGAVADYRGEDGALPAIREAALRPIAARGKVIVAVTPRTNPIH